MTNNGYNEEEMKMVKETKKIWGTNVSIAATCIRVPVIAALTLKASTSHFVLNWTS